MRSATGRSILGNGRPQRTEFRVEGLHMVGGKWSRPHQAHVAANDIPELGQLIKARTAHQAPDMRQDAWILFQLEMPLPVFAQIGIAREHALEPLFGIPIHRAQLQNPDWPAVAANAPLAIERWARIRELDREGEQPDDWRGEKQERQREDQIDGALQPLLESLGCPFNSKATKQSALRT